MLLQVLPALGVLKQMPKKLQLKKQKKQKRQKKKKKPSVIDPALAGLRATASHRARHHASAELGETKTELATTATPPALTTSTSSRPSPSLDEGEGKGEASLEMITHRIRAKIKEADSAIDESKSIDDHITTVRRLFSLVEQHRDNRTPEIQKDLRDLINNATAKTGEFTFITPHQIMLVKKLLDPIRKLLDMGPMTFTVERDMYTADDGAIAAGLDEELNGHPAPAPAPVPVVLLTSLPAPLDYAPLNYVDDTKEDNVEPKLPTPRITATDIPTLIARMQRLLRLGHTPEAIGAAIKVSGFDINGIRTGMRSKCNIIYKPCRVLIRDLTRGTWRHCEKEDDGMNALQLAVYHSNMYSNNMWGNSGPGKGTPLLPNAQKIIQALLAAGALPSVKVNAARLFRASSNHGLDALQLAFDNCTASSQEIIIMLLKAHTNPVPVINKSYRCILTHALSLHGYSAALIRQLFVSGAIANVNRALTKDELANVGIRYFEDPITPICLQRWFTISHSFRPEAEAEVISVLAEYGADQDPLWLRDPFYHRALAAWQRGREVWEIKQRQAAVRPVLTALTYGDLDPVGDGQRFDPAITSSSDAITSPATQILPKAIANIIVDMI